jgi:hypothetical protein
VRRGRKDEVSLENYSFVCIMPMFLREQPHEDHRIDYPAEMMRKWGALDATGALCVSRGTGALRGIRTHVEDDKSFPHARGCLRPLGYQRIELCVEGGSTGMILPVRCDSSYTDVF